MTSSSKKLIEGQRRWNDNVEKYKDYDPFCEPGLFSILVLANGRPEITKRCLLSTFQAIQSYDGDVEWILIENGECDENLKLFEDFPVDRKVIVRQKNYGIAEGLNQAWALSRGEFCMIHENDWFCRLSIDFLSISRDIFENHDDVHILQLRAVKDPNENWGYGKPEYSPWSCYPKQLYDAGVILKERFLDTGHRFFVSNLPNGFNNNPMIMRKSFYRKCGVYPESEIGANPRGGEVEYQHTVSEKENLTGHIGIELYYHNGQEQTKVK